MTLSRLSDGDLMQPVLPPDYSERRHQVKGLADQLQAGHPGEYCWIFSTDDGLCSGNA
jgi:hypothetical protein